MRIEADHLGKLQQLDHIDPPLTGFDVGDERLMASERGRDIALLQAGLSGSSKVLGLHPRA